MAQLATDDIEVDVPFAWAILQGPEGWYVSALGEMWGPLTEREDAVRLLQLVAEGSS
jgi:hypothetical protein